MSARTGNQCISIRTADMTKLRRAVNKPNTYVHYALQFHFSSIENAVKQAITVVQSTCDEGMNQLFRKCP